MPRIDFQYKRIKADEAKYGKGFGINTLPKEVFKSFNTSVLGLGDISKDGKYVQAIAAFYDLEGFTSFSNQVDSHLVIPEFLKRYLDWIFSSIAEKFKEGESDSVVRIWASLPFYAKFLGDGILFLWDTEYSGGPMGLSNLVIKLHRVCQKYQQEFLSEVRKHVSNPPYRLRCGVARGQLISIGDGNDYVGSCINIASRLQKLSQLSFAVSRRGLDLFGTSNKHWKDFILKEVELRGIGKKELVYINSKEFEGLPQRERKLFKDP
jgi:class 3 adenylate cyclase